MNTFICENPLHEGDRHCTNTDTFTTGYGVNEKDEKSCFACCGKLDRDYMIEHGVLGAYLSKDDKTGVYHFSNWPDSMSFKCFEVRKSKAAGFYVYIDRIDAWFDGPDGHVWHAVCKGDMDCATARRTKRLS